MKIQSKLKLVLKNLINIKRPFLLAGKALGACISHKNPPFHPPPSPLRRQTLLNILYILVAAESENFNGVGFASQF